MSNKRRKGRIFEPRQEIEPWWYCHVLGVAWLIIMGSGLDDWIYWHFCTITINYYSSESISIVEASLHSDSHCTIDCKRPSLSLIKVWHGPQTEKTLKTPYPNNSFIVILEVCLRLRRFIYCGLRIRYPENMFSEPLPSNGYWWWRGNFGFCVKSDLHISK
jgi:hypothetical protein